MNVDLLTTLASGLGGSTLDDLSRQIDAPKDKTQSALAAALPMLLGGLAKNTATPEGASSLATAVEKDHDGSVLDQVSDLFGGGGGGGGLGALAGLAGGLLGGDRAAPATKALDGGAILGHILGNKRPAVEEGVAKASGLDLAQVGKLLALVAPIIMGAIGKLKAAKGLDASGLAGMVQSAAGGLEPTQPGNEGAGLLGSLLDKDDDGQIADDIAALGMQVASKKLLGSLFGGD